MTTSNSSTRALAYVRVSTDEQEDGASISAQRRAIEQYAQLKRLTVVRYIEESESASVKGRRQFAELLRRLQRGQADTAIFHKLDRSTRNMHDWAKLSELMDNGMTFHFVADGVDSSTPTGRMMLDMLAALSTHFSRNLSAETKKGLRERLSQGLFPWPAPIGYLDASMLGVIGNTRDNRGRKRHPQAGVKVVDKERAPLVRRAFLMSAEGWSICRLVDELKKMGLTTREGGHLSKSQIHRMLHNPFYAGRIQVGDEEYEGIHDAIISMDLFEQVQRKLSRRVPYQQTPTRERLPFRLRGLIACASCGKTLHPERHKKRYVYYRCHTKSCPEKTLPEHEALQVLKQDLQDLQLLPHQERDLRQMLKLMVASSRADGQLVRAKNAANRVLLEQRRDKLVELFVAGSIDKDTYARLKRRYDSELSKRSRATVPGSESNYIERVARILELPKSALSSLLQGEVNDCHRLLKSMYSNFFGQGRTLLIERKTAFRLLHDLRAVPCGTPGSDSPRTRNTKEGIVRELIEVLKAEGPSCTDMDDPIESVAQETEE